MHPHRVFVNLNVKGPRSLVEELTPKETGVGTTQKESPSTGRREAYMKTPEFYREVKPTDLKKIDQALELSSLEELLKSVASVDLDQLKVEKMGPVEKYFTQREKDYLEGRLRSAKKAKKQGARLKPDRRKPEFRKKLHWKTRAKKRKEYYKQVAYPRYLRKMSQLQAEKGWYDIMKRGWENWGWKCNITREEWDTYVEPLLHRGDCSGTEEHPCKGCAVPFTERYNTSDPVITLQGIMIFDKQSTGRLRKPLFDGAEHHLKMMGYTL